MNCSEALAQLLADEVTPQAQDHIDSCEQCSANLAELAVTREVLSDPSSWAEPSPELRAKVLASSPGSVNRRQISIRSPRGRGGQHCCCRGGLHRGAPAADWEIDMYSEQSQPIATLAGWNEDTGTRLLFDGDLAKPDDGFVYELWFSDSERVLSAGTFASAEDVALTVAVRRSELPNLWVTLEPIDGDPRPSGEVILTSSK